MLRHADTVTVGFAMGAHLIRRLDAVAATLGPPGGTACSRGASAINCCYPALISF